MHSLFFTCALASLTFTLSAEAALFSFSPDQLSDFDANHVIEHQENPGIKSSTITDPTTESPNVLRFETMISASGQVVYTQEWLGASFEPSTQGAIDFMDFSIELSDPQLGDTNTPIFFGLKQAGVLYFNTANQIILRSFRPDELTSNFIYREGHNLIASDFAQHAPGQGEDWNKIDSTKNPDFSSSGSEITFVYGVFSGTGVNNTNFHRFLDIRNSNLDIQTIPEPGSLLLLALAGIPLLRRKRKSR